MVEPSQLGYRISCHMCRKVHEFGLVPNKEYVGFTSEDEDVSIDIELSRHDLLEGEKKLFSDLFPGEECKLYQWAIENCSRCIFIIHKDQIPEEVFMRLILCFSSGLLSTQVLRDFEAIIPGFQMIPVETHLHDFTNLVIKRVVRA